VDQIPAAQSVTRGQVSARGAASLPQPGEDVGDFLRFLVVGSVEHQKVVV